MNKCPARICVIARPHAKLCSIRFQSLSDANAELEEKLKDVRTDIQDSAIEMDRMTEEYTKLKMVLQQTDSIVEEMRKERDVLRAQVCSSMKYSYD